MADRNLHPIFLHSHGRDAVLALAPAAHPIKSTRVLGIQRIDVAGYELLLVMGTHPGHASGLAGTPSVLAVAPAAGIGNRPIQLREAIANESRRILATLTPAGRLALGGLTS